VAVLDAVDRGDARVIERRQHPGFAIEARQPIGILGERERQHLERDAATEPRVVGPVDFAHSAFAKLREDLVSTGETETRTWCEGHGESDYKCMRFVPYPSAAIPNIIVDGAANSHTVLTLSHWPKSGSPTELRADTST